VVESICPRCGKQTDGEMVDEDLYILVVCDKCEVILGILPKFYQKATWKAGKPREAGEEADEAAPAAAKGEPGASTIQALEQYMKLEDIKLSFADGLLFIHDLDSFLSLDEEQGLTAALEAQQG